MSKKIKKVLRKSSSKSSTVQN